MSTHARSPRARFKEVKALIARGKTIPEALREIARTDKVSVQALTAHLDRHLQKEWRAFRDKTRRSERQSNNRDGQLAADRAAQVQALINSGESHRDALAAVAKHEGITVERLRRTVSSLVPSPATSPVVSPEQMLARRDVHRNLGEMTRAAEHYRNQVLDQQAMLAAIRELVPALPSLPPFHGGSRKGVASKHSPSPAEICAPLSDWHAMRKIDRAKMEGYNEYNFTIMCERLWKWVQSCIEITTIQRVWHKIDLLWIPMLGDMMNDERRRENVRSNLAIMMQGTVTAGFVFAQAFRRLLEHFPRLEIHAVSGNEPRNPIHERVSSQDRNDNFDWLLYNIIALFLQAEIRAGRVRIAIPDSAMCVVQRASGNYLLFHGDQIRSWAGRYPYYGEDTFIAKQHEIRRPSHRNPTGIDFDYALKGHAHDDNTRHGGRIIVSGAACGTDPYARDTYGLADHPMQKLLLLTPRYGPTAFYILQLKDGDGKGHPFKVADPSSPVTAYL